MTRPLRRFEVLLPLKFNDGRPIPDELIANTILELFDQFGALSSETQIIRGQWGYAAEIYRDELVRVFVDADDSETNIEFFVDFKERLKQRFDQIDIWVVTYPIEIIRRPTTFPGTAGNGGIRVNSAASTLHHLPVTSAVSCPFFCTSK